MISEECIDQIQCPGCALIFNSNLFESHFNDCYKEDVIIPEEPHDKQHHQNGNTNKNKQQYIDVDDVDDDNDDDVTMYDDSITSSNNSNNNNNLNTNTSSTTSSPFQIINNSNNNSNNSTSTSSTTTTPPNSMSSGIPFGTFGQYVKGFGENVMNPKKLLEDLFKQDIHESTSTTTTTNNGSSSSPLEEQVIKLSSPSTTSTTSTTKESFSSFNPFSNVNNQSQQRDPISTSKNPFASPPTSTTSTSATSTTSTTSNSNPFNSSLSSSNHSFYDLEDHHNYYIEEDDEFKSLQLAKQLIEEERRQQLAEEEENNRRLVLELLEKEREAQEQERQTNVKDLETKCIKCSKQLGIDNLIFLDCSHIYCKECLHKSIIKKIDQKKVSKIKCKSCKTPLSSPDIKQVLNDQEYAKYDSASLEEVISTNKDSFIKCPNCNYIMEKLYNNQNNNDSNTKEFDQNGNELSKQAIEHKKLYRFRCLECTTVFCSECFEKPYHLGYTCDQFKNYSNSKHCRYCLQTLKSSNCSTLSNQCCNQPECMQKYLHSCKKKLPCGHNCCGIAGETTCPPCLVDDCPSANATQKSSDYCNICWVEELGSSPCIQLECGHIVHLECCKKKLTAKWNSSRISFGFMKCAICPKYIKHPALKDELAEIMALYNVIKEKGLQRLKVQGPEKGVNLKDPACKWYNNEEGYVMDRLSFFPCFKCKKPYFGGEKACGENNVDFKPEELLCGGCSCDGADNCKIHGKEYIEYKCKFCCNMSVFFCWGKTHFCNSCHSQSTTIVKTPKDQLPKCTCGLPHPPNGEEHSFGCSLCRITRD